MTVRTVLVCEAQVPFVHGGAEVHVRELRARAAARAATTPSSSACRSSGIRRRRSCRTRPRGGCSISARATAARSISSSRTKFPTYFVAASEQGRLADPPVPRRLRAVRHAVQRLRAQRARRRPARHADRGSTREMLGECRAVFANARNTAARLAKFNGLPGRAAVSSAAAGGAPRRRARTATTCSRSAGSNRSSAWTCSSRRWPASIAPIRLVVAGDGTQRANVERVAGEAGVADRVDVSRRRRRRRAARALRRRARRRLSAVRRGLRLRDARGVPGAEAGRSPHRFRRAERVRRGRRQRVRLRAGAGGARRRRSTALAARPARARPRWATRATTSRAHITWDGVIEKLVGRKPASA